MRLFKRSKLIPLSVNATLRQVKAKTVATWVDGRGQKQEGEVVERSGKRMVKIEGDVYRVRYHDHRGRMLDVSTKCRDKSAAEHVAQRLVSEVERRKAGIVSDAECDAVAHGKGEIAEHVGAFGANLLAAGCSAKYIAKTRSCILRVAADEGVKILRDMTGECGAKWLARHAEDSEEGKALSAQTRNDYRAALVAFGNWCRAGGRLIANPFVDLPAANVRADRKIVRRALLPEEAARLLRMAVARPLADRGREVAHLRRDGEERKRANWTRGELTMDNLSTCLERARQTLGADTVADLEAVGRERGMIYRTLLATGLRKGELASLTVVDVDLDRGLIHLRAENEKNREGNSLPVPADLVGELRQWIADKAQEYRRRNPARIGRGGKAEVLHLPGDTLLFVVPDGLVKILRRDMQAAGIPKTDGRGRTVDVHAMRMTFGTWLSAAGVPLRTAQAAMRHSDPKLTANIYTDAELLDVNGAVAKAANLLAVAQEQAQALRLAAGAEGVASESLLASLGGGETGQNGAGRGAFPINHSHRLAAGAESESGREYSKNPADLGVCGAGEVGATCRIRTDDLCFTKATADAKSIAGFADSDVGVPVSVPRERANGLDIAGIVAAVVGLCRAVGVDDEAVRRIEAAVAGALKAGR